MATYLERSKDDLLKELDSLAVEYADRATMLYELDMSRGKPSPEQLELSMDMLRLDPYRLSYSRDAIDARNYGYLTGLPEAKELFADILEVDIKHLLGAPVKEEDHPDAVAEQLSRINEYLAVRNRRSRLIWRVVLALLAIIFLLMIFSFSA